jgi:hypothetical protein
MTISSMSLYAQVRMVTFIHSQEKDLNVAP